MHDIPEDVILLRLMFINTHLRKLIATLLTMRVEHCSPKLS